MKALSAGALLGVAVFASAQAAVYAQPGVPRFEAQIERHVALSDALIETVKIEGQLQSWTLRKLCLDGQAYWLGFNETAPSTLTPVYKDGKPERCAVRGR